MRILPHLVPLTLRDFTSPDERSLLTLAPEDVEAQSWFETFAGRIHDALGVRYLPVARLSDGEYRFLFGRQPASPRLDTLDRWRHRFREAKYFLKHRGQFAAATLPGVSSGSYSGSERRQARTQYIEDLKAISQRGYLALHLTFGPHPFQEGYLPDLGRLIDSQEIELTLGNYVPFYFPYALLSAHLTDFVRGRHVAVATGADEQGRRRITEHLQEVGAKEVSWIQISPNRALFDEVSLESHLESVDIAFVGAGVAKLRIVRQLAPLEVPVIDAGFMLEVWNASVHAGARPFTAT